MALYLTQCQPPDVSLEGVDFASASQTAASHCPRVNGSLVVGLGRLLANDPVLSSQSRTAFLPSTPKRASCFSSNFSQASFKLKSHCVILKTLIVAWAFWQKKADEAK